MRYLGSSKLFSNRSDDLIMPFGSSSYHISIFTFVKAFWKSQKKVLKSKFQISENQISKVQISKIHISKLQFPKSQNLNLRNLNLKILISKI